MTGLGGVGAQAARLHDCYQGVSVVLNGLRGCALYVSADKSLGAEVDVTFRRRAQPRLSAFRNGCLHSVYFVKPLIGSARSLHYGDSRKRYYNCKYCYYVDG